MASKADMLKNGARKTATGLFNNIPPLKEQQEQQKKTVALQAEAPMKDTIESKVVVADENNDSDTVLTTEKVSIVDADIVTDNSKPIRSTGAEQANMRDNTKSNVIESREDAAKEKASAKTDKNSRYEKDKFLLLDVRGYRDYVEHMAKASNMSATKYIRSLIDEDMKRNMDIYMAHKQLEETLKGRR